MPGRKYENVPMEDTEQASLFRWAEFESGKYPALRWMYAVPNGGYRNVVTAKRLKATGVKSGVPDVMLPAAAGGYHGLYVEMKRIKNGTVSDNQKEWLSYLNQAGYKAIVCRGFDEARKAIVDYLTAEG